MIDEVVIKNAVVQNASRRIEIVRIKRMRLQKIAWITGVLFVNLLTSPRV